MAHNTKQVWDYLSFLKTYLLGDLETYHRVCTDIEQREGSQSIQTHGTSSLGSVSTSTTPETTWLPVGHGTSGYGGFKPENITPSFRMTQPITLSLFSTIDVLGYLISNNTEKENTKNITEFFKDFISQGVVSEDEFNVLLNICRHGMTHTFFPKLDVGISYHSSNKGKKLFFLLDEHGKKTLTLNVNQLEILVTNKLNDLVQRLENGEEPLSTNMEIQFQNMMNVYIGNPPLSNGKLSPIDHIIKLSSTL